MLQPGEMPPEVGTRPMDISDPGGGLPAAPQSARPVEIGLEGALRVPGAGPTAWPRRTMFVRALRKLLDAPARRSATAQSLPLVPPIYGRWHAARETVPADRGPNDKPYWLRELNLDPRNRVAAALGTQVVQERQDQLMERAWQQVGEIERANQALRQAQMARSAGVSMHTRHLSGLSPEAIVQITEPVHAARDRGHRRNDASGRSRQLPAAGRAVAGLPAPDAPARPGGPALAARGGRDA